MRLYSLKDVEEGMVLGKSIYHQNGKLLLGAGYRITSVIKAKLHKRGYFYIYIMEEGTDGVIPEDIISHEVENQAKMKLANKIAEISKQKVFDNMTRETAAKHIEEGYFKKLNIAFDIRNTVKDIIKDITSASSTFMNSTLLKTADTYFLDHALNVAVLSIFIGKKYGFSKDELISLGLGAFLHDIGKIIIGQMKDADQSKGVDSLYREHPTLGYLLMKNSMDISPVEAQIVNQHHEFQNGSGFPIGLKGQNLQPVKSSVWKMKGHIFRLAEICCVANAFDKRVFNPSEKKGKDLEQAIKDIIKNAGTLFNSNIVQTLIKVVPFYPVGTGIKVNSIEDPRLIGYCGVVAKINECNINRPIIILNRDKFLRKIKPILIDTSKLSQVELQLII